MGRCLHAVIATAAAFGLSVAAPLAAAAEEAATEPLSLSDFGDDAVCEAGNEECALSLRQLRAQVLAPESLPQHRARDEDDNEANDAALATAEALHRRAAKSAHRAVTSLVESVSGKGSRAVYHQTSPAIAQMIVREGFRPGHAGWCGGGIYFAMDPKATFTKAIGTESHKGVILQAWVNTGRVCRMEKHCDMSMNYQKLKARGCDSIIFNPGDGEELVVYDPSRVHSTKVVWMDSKLTHMDGFDVMSAMDGLSDSQKSELEKEFGAYLGAIGGTGGGAGAATVAGGAAEADAAADASDDSPR